MEMWGTDKVDELADDAIVGGVEYQKLMRREAKTGRILEDYRIGNQQRYIEDFVKNSNLPPEKARSKAVENVLVRSLKDDADRVSVEANSQGITATMVARIAEAAEALKPGRLGWKKQEQLMGDLVDELHVRGSTNNPKASKFADDVSGVLDELRKRFNRAGGAIKELSDWAMPHSHNASKVSKAGETRYIEDTLPLINRSRMKNLMGRPMNDEELVETLRASYRSIVGEEIDQISGEGGYIAGRHQEKRELHFTDGSTYRKYSEKYGDDNYYKTITDHIERLSREIALMETLGPNPTKGFNRISAGVDKSAAVDHEKIFKNLMGMNRPDKSLWLDVNAGIRPALSAAQLGSATLSSISDVGTMSVAAAFNGLGWGRMLGRLTSLTGSEARVFAAKLGGSIDYALDNVGMSVRFDDASGADWSQKLADTVFRASGLSAFTNLMRRAHFMEFNYTLASHKGAALKDIEPRFQGMLRSYGITDADWDVVRKTGTRQRNGEQFMDLTQMTNEGLQVKMMGILHQERDLAVLMPDMRTRALLNQGLEQGTVAGEGIRAFAQYKSYSVMMVMNNLYRYMASKRVTGGGDRLAYVSSLITATTLLGALSVQLKEISKGRDPRNMRDPDFFKAAFLQGGGAGILGDFAFSDSNRYGQPLWAAAVGPTGGLAWDSWKAGKGLVTGEEEKAANMLRYVPGQSLWYSRLVYERAIMDSFKKMVDPGFDRKARKNMRKRRTEHGQKYWAPPVGRTRAPDISATVERPVTSWKEVSDDAGDWIEDVKF
jgi:hypothetical protein